MLAQEEDAGASFGKISEQPQRHEVSRTRDFVRAGEGRGQVGKSEVRFRRKRCDDEVCAVRPLGSQTRSDAERVEQGRCPESRRANGRCKSMR